MENATEALMMAFAVLVLVMALTMSFMLISQARSTADVVFTTKDDQVYIEDITSIGQKRDAAGNLIQYRTVGIDTIIPTIYRYAQENYGVIIIDEGKIIGIYDLKVESTVSKYSTAWITPSNAPQQIEEICMGNSGTGVKGIQNYIDEACDFIPSNANDMSDFYNLFNTIYHIEEPTSIYCPWHSGTYSIMKRIKTDMDGGNYSFGESSTMKYKGMFKNETSFINKYGSETFTEYYYNVKTKNNLTEEEETEKLQIIYVKE